MIHLITCSFWFCNLCLGIKVVKESILLFLSGGKILFFFSMEGVKRVFMLGRSSFTPNYASCRLLPEAFRKLLSGYSCPTWFACSLCTWQRRGGSVTVVQLQLSLLSLPCCSCTFLALQFSWLGWLSLLFPVGNACSMAGWVAEQEPSRLSWMSGAYLSQPTGQWWGSPVLL